MDRKREEKELKSGNISLVSPSFSITHGILPLPWGSLLTWRPFLWFFENLKQEKGTLLVADPDLLIGGGEGEGCRPNPEVRGGGRAPLLDSPLFACEYSHLFSLLATGDAKRLSWWGARRDAFTRRLKGSWRVLFRYCLSVICGMISFTP